jgi:ATP-dependent Zn protease
MTDDETRVAYHEAGHTVVAHSLGIGVERVSIVEDEDSLGISRSPLREGFDYYLDEDADEYLGKHLVVCQAGAVAEEILTGQLPELEGNDREGTVEILIRISDPENNVAKHQESMDRAREILRDNWPKVQRLAAALLKHRELSAEQVEDLLSDEEEDEDDR